MANSSRKRKRTEPDDFRMLNSGFSKLPMKTLNAIARHLDLPKSKIKSRSQMVEQISNSMSAIEVEEVPVLQEFCRMRFVEKEKEDKLKLSAEAQKVTSVQWSEPDAVPVPVPKNIKRRRFGW